MSKLAFGIENRQLVVGVTDGLMSKIAFGIENRQLVVGVTHGNTKSCVGIRHFEAVRYAHDQMSRFDESSALRPRPNVQI